MTRINTNVSSLVAQNRLHRSNNDLQQALTRLSTGLRINSGSDDPAGLIASEALRSEISSLGKAISNTQRASQIISTADSALGQVSSLLTDIQGLVVEAANRGALSDDEIAANQLQIDSSLEAINRIAQTTTFQGRKLLDGSLDFVTDANLVPSIRDSNIDQANLGSTGQIDVEVVVTAAATQATVTSSNASFSAAAAANVAFGNGTEEITVTAAATGAAFNNVQIQFVDDTAAGDVPAAATYDATQKVITVTYNSTAATPANASYDSVQTAINGLTDFGAAVTGGVGATAFANPTTPVSTAATGGEVLLDDLVFQLNGATGSETFNFGVGTSSTQIAAAINLVADSTGVGAVVDATGLVFTSTAYGTDALVNIDVIDEGPAGTFAASLSAIRDTGTDIEAAVNGVEADGDANTLSINTSTLDLNITVDDGSAANFSFSITDGGALFQLGPDVTSNQQARLGIGSVSTAQLGGATGRLYELGSGQTNSLTGDINGAGSIIDEVINKVTSLRGRLGAFQATTLESNLVSLNDTKSNLLEAESSIRDADFARETAQLTRAQILVQSGTNVLSLANQAPQNILALLRN
jgi:flagellin